MTPVPGAKAKLRGGSSVRGWIPYWIVDEQGRQLNTEPVCLVPDDWHDWFKEHIEEMEFNYWGLPEKGDHERENMAHNY